VRVRLSPDAIADVEDAQLWYDGRELGIGDAFRGEVDATVKLISERPEMFAIAFARMRRAILKKFPYFLLYEVFPDIVIVFGVIHGARDPLEWMKRGDT